MANKQVALRTKHDRYLSAGNENQKWAVTQTPEQGSGEIFQLIELGNGKIALKTAHGRYLSARNENQKLAVTQTPEQGSWEIFQLIKLSNGEIALKTAHGRYLSARKENEKWTVTQTPEQASWEAFKLVTPKVSKPVFPINAEQHTELGDHHRMRTSIKVSNTGRLDGRVRIWTANKTQGFHGLVIVFLLDQDTNILWNTQVEHKYGINAAGVSSENSRDETFTESIPQDVLMRVRNVLIYHKRDPDTYKKTLENLVTTVQITDNAYKRIKDTEVVKTIIATAMA